MSRLRLPAPAKLNLFLHITGRRPDGYHTLETLFQLLDYGDELDFEIGAGKGLEFSCSRTDLAGDSNLVLQAARLLVPRATVAPDCHIRLLKRLPTGSGLGGGSSDAATTLLALNRLWHCGYSQAGLEQLGLQLGADVPVFVHGYSAFAHGVGEKLVNQAVPERWYVVITPACEVSTREIFCDPELTRNSPSMTMRDSFLGGRNDCQAVSCKLYPPVKAALDWLGQFAEARMTGTGASVFASFPAREAAMEVLSQLSAALSAALSAEKSNELAGCQGFVARGVNRSPLLDLLNQSDR